MKKFLLSLLAGITSFSHAESLKPEQYIAQSYVGLQDVTAVHSKTWGLGSEANWGVDLNAGKISFIFEDGKKAIADVQVIGTFSPNGTFMWGWDHPSVKGEPAKHAMLLKTFGEKHQIKELLTQPVKITEQQAWEYTAVAMRLGNNNGAYRANAGGGTWVYMTFGEVSLSKGP